VKSRTLGVLAVLAVAGLLVIAGLSRGSTEPIREPVFPDDLEVVVEITPDIEDLYSRCVAVLTVAEVPTRVCEDLEDGK
jgi:hypothetical protein